MILHDVIEDSGAVPLTEISSHLYVTESFNYVFTAIKSYKTAFVCKLWYVF